MYLIIPTTDVGTDHNLVIYMHYILDGEVHTCFLYLVELTGGTASEIETVLKVFIPRIISLDKLCGIATDRASALVCCRTGVTTQFTENISYLLSILCIAHRLALASGQAADCVPYIKQYQLYVNNIYNYFHYSTTHMHKLKEIQSILQLAEQKFHQVFHTHWL